MDSIKILHPLLFSSVQSLSGVWLFATSWTAACLASLFVTNSQYLLKFMSIESVMPSKHLILCRPLQSFPASESFPMSQFFALGGQSIRVLVSVLPMHIQDWLPLGWTGSPCSPRDSQGSSPTPQFKDINSWVLSFLYGLTLTSIHDYWKSHSFD